MAKRHQVNGQFVLAGLILAGLSGFVTGNFFVGVIVLFAFLGFLVFNGNIRL